MLTPDWNIVRWYDGNRASLPRHFIAITKINLLLDELLLLLDVTVQAQIIAELFYMLQTTRSSILTQVPTSIPHLFTHDLYEVVAEVSLASMV